MTQILTHMQTINFESWDSYYNWAAHVKAATALLRLRGREQFTTERGVLLYTQIRSQIVSYTLDATLSGFRGLKDMTAFNMHASAPASSSIASANSMSFRGQRR